MPKKSRAFTLIELLVVIAIIAILAGLIFSVFGGVVRNRDRTAGMNNVRQVGVAFSLYAGEHDYEIPGRAQDGDNNVAKWPAVLAGYEAGTYNSSTDYVKDVHVYLAPGYSKVNRNRSDLTAFLTSNAPNHTSWTMNGYNDVGDKGSGAIAVRLNTFTAPGNTILLGMHKTDANHFYMDFDDGDNKNVIELHGYGSGGDQAGSVYVMADGSARFITLAEYNKPAPANTNKYGDCYGDWLWLSNKD